MAISKGITYNKTRSFTFRITDEMSKEITKLKAECARNGLRWNVTEALTKALEQEIKAAKKVVSADPNKSPL